MFNRLLGKSSTQKQESMIVDMGDVIHSGYLVKLATKSMVNWKKRFFILHENNIKYFPDHLSLTPDKCKGDIQLTPSSYVIDIEKKITGKNFCIFLKNEAGEQLIMSAKDEEDAKFWKECIDSAINRLKNSMRGYAIKLDKFDEKPIRKYFILQNKVLTYHEDEKNTRAIQGMMTLTQNMKLQISEELCAISITDENENRLII